MVGGTAEALASDHNVSGSIRELLSFASDPRRPIAASASFKGRQKLRGSAERAGGVEQCRGGYPRSNLARG